MLHGLELLVPAVCKGREVGYMEFSRKDSYTVQDLLAIVEILRSPGGCPWDREQTHESIRKNLIEETYEVADAIDQQDTHLLCEELGDLLLQVMLHTEMEKEKGTFTFDDVCDGLCKKLVYRHPHVFGQAVANTSEQVVANWEPLKNAEKGRKTAADRLNSVPQSLPALMKSEKLQKRAAEFGFAYNSAGQAMADLEAEVQELKEAIATGENTVGELGDVLFAAVNVAGKLHTDAEEALTLSAGRFAARVKKAEELAAAGGENIAEAGPEKRDALWKQAKALLKEQ
ncbi:MAG: nucleoside triphosphate pyrophosphohydrolase [Oscillospiraceae bacterium]